MDYRIDELARAARTTPRNVRAYQDRGILPPPRREGRVAWYSDAHLARLRVIAALLDRGFSIANIAEMVDAWERGSELRDVLGLEDAITSPFSDEAPSSTTPAELLELFGTFDPLSVARAVEVGLLEVDKGSLVVPSLRVLRAGAELHRAGVPLPALLDEFAALRRDLDRIGARFVDLVITHLLAPDGAALPDATRMPALATMVRRIRPLAALVVTSLLARSLEAHVKVRLGEQLGRLLGRERAQRAKR